MHTHPSEESGIALDTSLLCGRGIHQGVLHSCEDVKVDSATTRTIKYLKTHINDGRFIISVHWLIV